MCLDVLVDSTLGGIDGILDVPSRTLVLNAALPPLRRTVVTRALLLDAGVPQAPPGPVLACLCGKPLVVEDEQKTIAC